MSLVLAAVLLFTAFAANPKAHAQASGLPLHLAAGWSFAAFPAGSDLSNVPGPLFHFMYTSAQPNGGYESVDPRQGTETGSAYWAYEPADTSVTLGAGSDAPMVVRKPPAGFWHSFGNPSGTHPAIVDGADVVYTYSPLSGYQRTTLLLPGQGAWYLTTTGNDVTVTPLLSGFYGISKTGYSIDLPFDWQPLAKTSGLLSALALPNPETVDLIAAPLLTSPSQFSLLLIRTLSVVNLPMGATDDLLQSAVGVLNDEAQSVQATSPAQILSGPSSLMLPNADAAARVTGRFTAMSNATSVEITESIELILSGQTLYAIDLASPTANFDPARSMHILDSFQLTP